MKDLEAASAGRMKDRQQITRYQEFYCNWLECQKLFIKQLQEALKNNLSEHDLNALVQKAALHYAYYYRVKDEVARQDVLKVFAPSFKTPLESAFMWIGGWRPTLIFQLAYAQAGRQIESELAELMAGIDSPTMASITAMQLERINELHEKTLKLEENYSQQEAVLQQAMADQPFVNLAQTMMSGDEGLDDEDVREAASVLEENVNDKLKELETLVHEADRLRSETLQGILQVLTTIQAAEFLVAAAQLQLAYRAVGKMKEELAGDEGSAGGII